jgi:hypothetical protein
VLRLPDILMAGPEKSRHLHVNGSLLRDERYGDFIRCQLPVQLSGGVLLVFGAWVRVGAEDFDRAQTLWDTPEFAGQVFEGTLANSIQPWGEGLLEATVTAVVRVADEIPYVESSDHELANAMVGGEWDRDKILGLFTHALPIPVRVQLDERWSVERSAELAGRIHEGMQQFATDDGSRRVQVTVLVPDRQLGIAEQLAALREGTPWVHENDQLLEPTPNGVRHAIWYGTNADGREHFRLHGLVVAEESTVVVGCEFDDLADLPWAQHVWRSVAANDVSAAESEETAHAAESAS